ncbi:hypothetical protein [Paenibacillus sp. Y412MC10]|uniref:hypothetical protein n=1 Tax=Geobacillus sp. (strain Y412MC10) TaxID=481743 RepID=UPI0016432561|nr:hypothetical protein [Paenibacillus sp. Y412MC10]
MHWLKVVRNKAEHYQFVVSSDVIKSNIAQLLSQLIPFLKKEMVEEEYLDSEDERYSQIKDYLNKFDKYVTERLKLIEKSVDAIEIPLHECPDCDYVTFINLDGYQYICLTCGVKPTQEDLTTCVVCADKIVYQWDNEDGEYEPSFCDYCSDCIRNA